MDAWAATLQQRFGGRPMAVCLEQSRGALVYMLSKYAHVVLFPVHPTTSARYRRTFSTAGASDDQGDTAWLLDLLLRHRERLRRLQPDPPKPACGSFWWRNAGARWMRRRGRAIA